MDVHGRSDKLCPVNQYKYNWTKGHAPAFGDFDGSTAGGASENSESESWQMELKLR